MMCEIAHQFLLSDLVDVLGNMSVLPNTQSVSNSTQVNFSMGSSDILHCTKQELVRYNLADITVFAISTIEKHVYIHCILSIPNILN